MRESCLVVLSGGQDSTTCLFWAKERYKHVHAVTFDYGQRHRLELQAARKVAELARVDSHEVIEIPECLVSTSPLTSDKDLEQYDSHRHMEQVIGDRREDTFVPMRNGLFITVAANRAEALGVQDIVLGVCQMDNANYDDCRAVFINSALMYVNTALGHDHRGVREPIGIVTPLMFLSKAETALLAKELGDDCWRAMAYTHTSYDGTYPPTDRNHANVLRAHGFREAGLPDPLVVRAWKEGLMDLPDTPNYAELKGSNQ